MRSKLLKSFVLPIPGGAPGSSVVISGGLGVLGSLVGSWASAAGAHNLTLLGRSASGSGNAALERLKTGAAAATFAMCDMSSAEDCAARCGNCHGPPSSLFFHAGKLFHQIIQKLQAGGQLEALYLEYNARLHKDLSVQSICHTFGTCT